MNIDWDNNPLIQAVKKVGSVLSSGLSASKNMSPLSAANITAPFNQKPQENPLIQAAKAQAPQISPQQSSNYVQPRNVFQGYSVDSVRNLNTDQRNKLVATLVAEGANEGREGMNAILSTMINRSQVNPTLWGKNIFDVVSNPAQYTGFGDSNFAEVRDYLRGQRQLTNKDREAQIKMAQELVDEAISGSLVDNTGGATHYYNPDLVDPEWASRMEDRGVIGNHHFYYSKN